MLFVSLGVMTHSTPAPSSDFVAVYYELDKQQPSITIDPVIFQQAVPMEIQIQLQNLSLEFDELSPLLQRAVLWDNGYSLGDNNSLAQIHTLCGLTMAQLATTTETFSTTGCGIQSCDERSNITTAYARKCRANQLMAATKCSCTAVDTESTAPLWSNSSIGTDAIGLAIRIRKHSWMDFDRNASVHVYAIHASTSGSEKEDTTMCPSTAPAGSPLVIPCVSYQRTDARWCRPEPSSLLRTWLNEYASSVHVQKQLAMESRSSTNTTLSSHEEVWIKDEHGITIDTQFTFDGRTSDLSQQFYRRYIANTSSAVTPMVIDGGLPTDITQRLSQVSLQFTDLSPLLQRALVWDSGYAYGDGNTLAAIYTLCGHTMADIAVSERNYNLTGCTLQSCTNNSSRSLQCTGDQIATASLCAVTDVTSTPMHAAIWGTGGSNTMIPDANIVRHAWVDRNRSYLIYGIHMIRNEVALGNCPDVPSLIVPCLPYVAVSSTNQWCRPQPSALVTSWLKMAAKTHHKQFDLLLLLPMLLALTLLACVIACCLRRKTKLKRLDRKTLSLYQPHWTHTASAYSHHSSRYSIYESSTDMFSPRMSMESCAAMRSNSVLNELLNNPTLSSKRLVFEELLFDCLLAQGAHGEVWLCTYHGQQVAVKRMLSTRKHKYEDLESFTSEIALTADLEHPNILAFRGVAWNQLQNLCMATEYVANGDLQRFLRHSAVVNDWTWSQDKRVIAIGIACGLEYLHQRDPVMIHRDLKSKNILLTATLEAKLIDFGVSRNKNSTSSEGMMTSGVGTPYWTAPEILQGRMYSEQADMYSFGIVLCELDTRGTPYQDMRARDGSPEFTPLQILQHVVAGTLRPTISKACPQPMTELIHACLDGDPLARPSASQVLSLLRSFEETSRYEIDDLDR